MTGLSLRTVITALERLRDICSLKILHGNLKLGGRGKTIEIDESMFGHKRNTIAGGSVKARGFSVWSREVLDKLWHSVYRTGQEKHW